MSFADSSAGAHADPRLPLVQAWTRELATRHALAPETLRIASSDASFRRYFRVDGAGGAPSRILMDAPPPQEDCRPFVHAAQVFARTGMTVPEVLEADLGRGLLLLTDFGTRTYLDELADPARVDDLYADAMAALMVMQAGSRADVFPVYDGALLRRELDLFPEWYVSRHKGAPLTDGERQQLEQMFALLIANNLSQPRVFVHRDYHSRNLMLLAQGNPGVLDFQDAVYGPITYDLVSLLRDAYLQWPEEQVVDWVVRYWEQARRIGLPVHEDMGEFWRDFDWMGLQRHLKVLGIFARLSHRDGKDRYLADLPRVLDYVMRTARRYSVFGPLVQLLERLEGERPTVGYTF